MKVERKKCRVEFSTTYFMAETHCACDPSSGSTGYLVCPDLSTVLFIHFFSSIENRQDDDSSAVGGDNMA